MTEQTPPTRAEHRAEAERLLTLAGDIPMMTVTVPKSITPEAAQKIRQQFEDALGRRPLVLRNGIEVNDNGILLAALTHALLAQPLPTTWAEGYGPR